MKEKPYYYLFCKKFQTCKKKLILFYQTKKAQYILNRKIYFGNPHGGTVEYMSYNTKVHMYLYFCNPALYKYVIAYIHTSINNVYNIIQTDRDV